MGQWHVHDRESGSLHVVPPRGPRRPVAALRHRLAHRARWTGSRARVPLESGRRVDDVHGPRGSHPNGHFEHGKGEVMSLSDDVAAYSMATSQFLHEATIVNEDNLDRHV